MNKVDAKVDARVHNLEVCIMALMTLIQDTLPPAYADGLGRIINSFFDNSKELGAFTSVQFISAKEDI
jgi:hypothetical protein